MTDCSGPKTIRFPDTACLVSPAARGLLPVCMALILFGGSGAWGETRISPDPQIARVNHAGFNTRGYCTGFSTRDGQVFTAAHCLPKIRTDTVHILLGYEAGKLERHIQTPATSYRIIKGRDIAAMCDIESDPDGFRLISSPLTPGTRVEVQGYGAPRVHALQKTACSVRSISGETLIRLDCPLPPGISGAPVTLTGSRNVIAIVSASSAAGSLAYRLSADDAERLCE
jgi:hypothetical protein